MGTPGRIDRDLTIERRLPAPLRSAPRIGRLSVAGDSDRCLLRRLRIRPVAGPFPVVAGVDRKLDEHRLLGNIEDLGADIDNAPTKFEPLFERAGSIETSMTEPATGDPVVRAGVEGSATNLQWYEC